MNGDPIEIEKKLEKIESMIRHLHEHLEDTKVQIAEHDMKLRNLADIIHHSMDGFAKICESISRRAASDVDLYDLDKDTKTHLLEEYTPIDEEDKLKHDQKLDEIKLKREYMED